MENALLQELNKATGAILDDDTVVATLEKLKTEVHSLVYSLGHLSLLQGTVTDTAWSVGWLVGCV